MVPENAALPGACFFKDLVDSDLTKFTKELFRKYLKPLDYTMKETTCNGCSDHASWTEMGYPAVYFVENDKADIKTNNPHMHKMSDLIYSSKRS